MSHTVVQSWPGPNTAIMSHKTLPSKKAPGEKALVSKLDNMSSIPVIHMTENTKNRGWRQCSKNAYFSPNGWDSGPRTYISSSRIHRHQILKKKKKPSQACL